MEATVGARRSEAPGSGGPEHRSLIDAWRARVARNPDRTAITYFDGKLTAAELDKQSDALAAAFQGFGTGRGDRVAVYLQNIPQYAVVLLALWKVGATALILNPMYQGRELRRLIDDAEASGFICADSDVSSALPTLSGSTVRWVVSTSPQDYQDRNDPRVFAASGNGQVAPQGDLVQLISLHAGKSPRHVDATEDDVALLAYTSGTTGPPKGAMNTHGSILAVVYSFGACVGLQPGDVVFGIAPLFHITGAIINATLSLLTDTTLVLANRFHPEVALEAFVEQGVTFTIGSITAFNAIYQLPQASRDHFAAVKQLYSGGAPIPPSTVERFEQKLGVYIHNVYGMTETCSAVIAVPAGRRAPIHQPSGTLSVGLALPSLTARVVDPEGVPLPSGEQGELELTGPQVVPGYWRKPEATTAAMPGGRLRTGDVAIIDEGGWIYLVDRLKDQINVSGFKVWPREVEDVLYEHRSVREVAVVGEPDEYRGESVTAYVSLTEESTAAPEELIAFARERLAAYKAPRRVVVLEDIPKTQTGKIRRNVLRDDGAR